MRQLFFVFVAITFISCQPDSKEFTFPEGIKINTLPVNIPGGESILLSSDIIIEGEISLIDPGVTVIEHGLIWGFDDDWNNLLLADSLNDYDTPPMGYSELGAKISPGKFQSEFNISGMSQYSHLSGEVAISARAYAITNKGVAYGEVVTFTSLQQATIEASPYSIVVDQAELNGQIIYYFGLTNNLLDHGFVYLATEDPYDLPTIFDNKVANGPTENYGNVTTFENSISNLSANTSYLYRAYIITSDSSVWYSTRFTENSFKTPGS